MNINQSFKFNLNKHLNLLDESRLNVLKGLRKLKKYLFVDKNLKINKFFSSIISY